MAIHSDVYPRFYQISRYENLFINKRVAGFYIPEPLRQTLRFNKQYYHQTITLGGKSHLFVYRKISIPRFFPFTKQKLCRYMDSLISEMSAQLGAAGEFNDTVLRLLLTAKIKGIGIPNGSDAKKSGDSVCIISPSGEETTFLKDSGKPILIPYYEVYFRPLGYFTCN
jgi:hypothetical protein